MLASKYEVVMPQKAKSASTRRRALSKKQRAKLFDSIQEGKNPQFVLATKISNLFRRAGDLLVQSKVFEDVEVVFKITDRLEIVVCMDCSESKKKEIFENFKAEKENVKTKI